MAFQFGTSAFGTTPKKAKPSTTLAPVGEGPTMRDQLMQAALDKMNAGGQQQAQGGINMEGLIRAAKELDPPKVDIVGERNKQQSLASVEMPWTGMKGLPQATTNPWGQPLGGAGEQAMAGYNKMTPAERGAGFMALTGGDPTAPKAPQSTPWAHEFVPGFDGYDGPAARQLTTPYGSGFATAQPQIETETEAEKLRKKMLAQQQTPAGGFSMTATPQGKFSF